MLRQMFQLVFLRNFSLYREYETNDKKVLFFEKKKGKTHCRTLQAFKLPKAIPLGQQDFQKSPIIEGRVVQSSLLRFVIQKLTEAVTVGGEGEEGKQKIILLHILRSEAMAKITLSSHALFDTFCFKKLQEFMIHSIRSLELEMLVLMCDKTVSNCYPNKCIFCCNRLSCLLLQTFAAWKNLQAFRSHTSVPLVLNSLKLPQFVLRLPLTLRNDCEKTWYPHNFV